MQQIVYEIIDRCFNNETNNNNENNTVNSDITITPPLSTKNDSNNSNKDSQKDIKLLKRKIFFIYYYNINKKDIKIKKKPEKFLEKKRKRFFMIKKMNKKPKKILEKDEENNNYINKEDPSDLNGLKLYEGMLITAEKNIRNHIRNEQELKLIIDELEGQLDDINNGHNTNKKISENLFNFHPINTGLMNHLKKENEKLRKLVISYELKNKKNK